MVNREKRRLNNKFNDKDIGNLYRKRQPGNFRQWLLKVAGIEPMSESEFTDIVTDDYNKFHSIMEYRKQKSEQNAAKKKRRQSKRYSSNNNNTSKRKKSKRRR